MSVSFRQNSQPRPRLKKLRIVAVLMGLALLAAVSWIFGIMMAVAQDLPALENRAQYVRAENSVVYDVDGERIATLTGNEQRILVGSDDISPTIKQAIVAIEDRRFYEHRGIDYLGIARAVYQDILAGSAIQGASTITQQFVKNALEAQSSRTVFQKLRESALAYHLERQWSKEKILTEYLNSIYFGEGAYGIEAAARTFFGWAHPGCGEEGSRCASELLPHEAALLAGMIASPDSFNPRVNPDTSRQRRDIVLQKMLEQRTLAEDQYQQAIDEPLPAPSRIVPPKEESEAPYFTSWLRQQVVDHYGAGQAFGGGLQIKSTIDLDLQRRAEEIVAGTLGAIGPTASVVVLDNDTAAVRAMVGGSDYEVSAFNLAVNGSRQPGSAWKPFTLVTALQEGRTLNDVFVSEPKSIPFTAPGYKQPQQFVVNNYADTYRGAISLFSATTYSDNSVYAEVGMEVGTKDIATTAHAMGIRSRLSKNPAMILGGLKQGVSPLEMTHAFVTLAHGGQRVSGTLAAYDGGPVAIAEVKDSDGELVEARDGDSGDNEPLTQQVIAPGVADQTVGALESVVQSGTGVRANPGEFAWGKTGTTEDNGNAWFCGATKMITACVWVGHPDTVEPMLTEFAGQPVDGGTYPALIWHDVVLAYNQTKDEDAAGSVGESIAPVPESTVPVAPAPVEEASAPEPVEPEPAPQAQGAPAGAAVEGAPSGGVGGIAP